MGGSFSQKRSLRAAKVVMNRTGSYLGFPVVSAGWAGGRSVKGCSEPEQQWHLSLLQSSSIEAPLHNMPLSELAPAGMKWEGKECSEEVKRRAGWAFLEHLEEFRDSGIAVLALSLIW